jgi:hypothetical protein
MNLQLIRDAVDNLRKVATRGTYRRLLAKDLVDLEVHLQQILAEVNAPDTLWDLINKSLRTLK